MRARKRVTEADLKETERMMAASYARLKMNLMQAPEKALAAAGTELRRHPILALALFAGACAAGYGLMRALFASSKRGESDGRGSGWSSLVAGLVPVALPYLIELVKGTGRK